MYDDLARTQQPPPLEWFAVHAVIPSMVLTLLAHFPAGSDEYLPASPPRFTIRSEPMKGFSSAVSIMSHVAVGAAVLCGTTTSGRSHPAHPQVETIVFRSAPNEQNAGRGGPTFARPITIAAPDLGSIPTPSTLPQTDATAPPFSPYWSPAATSSNQTNGWMALTEHPAEVLTSPLPVYPDLLRQAGVQGTVVLEAVVDTTGRVLPASVLVVSATNPGFVAPARQALLATLFRPAMVGGKAVQMRIRLPYDFTIRNGMGRAR